MRNDYKCKIIGFGWKVTRPIASSRHPNHDLIWMLANNFKCEILVTPM